MTLEEINKRLKKNPYYQGSQAQKEAQAGLSFQGDNVVIPENSRQQIEQIRQEYGNGNTDNSFSKRDYSYISIDRNSKTNKMNYSKFPTISNIIETPRMKEKINKNSNIRKNKELLKSHKEELDKLYRSKEYTDLQNWLNTDTNFKKSLLPDKYNERLQQFEALQNRAKELNKKIDEIKKENIDLSDVTEVDRLLAPLNSAYTGVQSTIRGIGNAINRLSGNQELLYEGMTPEEHKSQKLREKQTGIEKVVSDVSSTAGQIATLAPLSLIPGVGPVASTAGLGLSAAGEAYKSGIEEGKEDKEALVYAGTVGSAEALLQKALGGIKVFGNSVAGNKVNKFIDKVAKSEAGKKSLNYISDVLGEGAEEYLQSVLEPVCRNIAYKENNKVNLLDEEALYSGMIGALSAGALNAPSYIKNKRSNVQNKDIIPLKEQNKTNEMISKNSSNESIDTKNEIINNNMTQNESYATQIQNSVLNGQIKNNIIDTKVKEYINNSLSDFKTNINISTDVINNNNLAPVDYKTAKQVNIYKKARDLFGNIGKKVFSNNSEDIYVSNTDINESIAKTMKNPSQKNMLHENLAVFSQLDKIIESGKEISSTNETKGRDKYNDWKYYVSNVMIDNKPYVVEFDTVFNENDKKRHFRLERIYNINEEVSATGSNKYSVNQFGTETSSINNIIPQNENYASNNRKILNPTEISNLKEHDVSTTPKLPNISYQTQKGNNSKFYDNLISKTDMLNDNIRNLIKNESDIKYYQGVTNEQSLSEAYNRLNEDGARETMRWFGKDLSNKNVSVSATEVAEGWILLKQYQDAGDYESAVNVAKKMRDMATKTGQALQAYSIQARLTPEGMFHYAQSELQDAFERFSKNKTQKWIDKHKADFDLKPEETQAIIEKVKEAQKLDNNSYEKKEKLAEINKIMTDKLPPERGAGIKSWMRISMLFNSKTQVRNVLGNAVIAPVNTVSDFISSVADNALAKKTGVRTTGNTSIVNYAKGFVKGLYESYSDFKKGINTRDISGDRFEIGQGKSYKDKRLGKVLNRIDSLLNFVLDAGDRPFYEATFTNSINNQLVLNNTYTVTQDMIDIATNEALSRTWQDSNNYTKFVLSVRNTLNKANIGGYGLGDILIPFAKTPANLTKAIVDYSPVGVVNTLLEGNNVRKAISRGDLTAQQQHRFVQDLGKATAGSMLYILGYALAKAGITSGESDEDKDIANFMKNNLGVSNYSIKIGNKTFTYDWAQPIAAPLAMMANLANKDNEEATLLEKITSTLNVPLNTLLEQSFMQSINTVFSNNDGPADGLFEAVAELPSRAIPALLKQITDMTDSTQRTTYEKGKPIQTSINKVKEKIPGLSKQLAPVTNTLGQEVKKYGGETNPFLYAFHTFINPANVNSNQKNKAGIEIYKVYQKTGDKTIFPRQAEYSQIIDGTKINLTSAEKSTYQKNTGEYYSKVVNQLLKSNTYKKLSDNEKAKILKEIASDSNEIAKENLAKTKSLKYERQKTDVRIDKLVKNGLEYSNAYIYKTQIKNIEGDKDKNNKVINGSSSSKKAKYIMDLDTSDNQKDKLLSLLGDSDTIPSVSDLKKLNGEYLTYMQQSGSRDKGVSQRDKYMMYIDAGIPVKTLNKYYSDIGKIEGIKNSNGKTITGSKKQAIFEYINQLKLNPIQKKILFTKSNKSYGKNYKKEIFQYIDSLKISKHRKEQIWKELYD